MEQESATLTPPTQQGDASGGSSPGQLPAEPITERKLSDVTSGLIQTLEEKEEPEEGPPASVAANWVCGSQETNEKLTGESARNEHNNTIYIYYSVPFQVSKPQLFWLQDHFFKMVRNRFDSGLPIRVESMQQWTPVSLQALHPKGNWRKERWRQKRSTNRVNNIHWEIALRQKGGEWKHACFLWRQATRPCHHLIMIMKI